MDYSQQLANIVANLSEEDSLHELFHQHIAGNPIPSVRSIKEIVRLCRSIICPGYFGNNRLNHYTLRYQMGVEVERLNELLSEQIAAAICFHGSGTEMHARTTVSSNKVMPLNIVQNDYECQQKQAKSSKTANPCTGSPSASPAAETSAASDTDDNDPGKCINCTDELKDLAQELALQFIERLAYLRSQIALDVKAMYKGDPAATSYGEIICCYPGVRAILNYRIAHELLLLRIPLIPRAVSELAHSETGIDIHPGATIGSSFSIDHGTGVVIGETSIIGNNVRLYQGVTLGAKSLPVDEQGMVIDFPRHPILEDDVVVYSNATILGRITIGKGSVIGGNVWVTEDVPAGSKVLQKIQTNLS